MQTTDCGIIILAAGSSSRLVQPKQLLMYKNKNLLQHAIDEATAINTCEVMVVVGAKNDEIVSKIYTKSVQIVHNENWSEGMSSSIRAGLSALLKNNPSLASVIIMLCDQPFVSSQLLNEIYEAKRATNKGIVACFYKETAGVPALFTSKYFAQLLSLQGNEGAKKIVMMNGDDVATIPFPLGETDIDTMQDYIHFQDNQILENS